MEHKLRLKSKEKIEACLSLSGLLLNLMLNNLSKREFERRAKIWREKHLKRDYLLLSRLSKIK